MKKILLILSCSMIAFVSAGQGITPAAAKLFVTNVVIDSTTTPNTVTYNAYNQAGFASAKSYALQTNTTITVDTVVIASGSNFFTAAKRMYWVKAVTAAPILYCQQSTLTEGEVYQIKVDSVTGGFAPFVSRTGVDINFRFNNGALSTFFYLKVGTYYMKRIGPSVFVDYIPQLLTGVTSVRPTLNANYAGQQYYNASGYYEIWDGTNWSILNHDNVVAKSANYTTTLKDNIIEITADATTQTLLSATGFAGKRYTFKLTAVGTATIATTSSQLIDAATTYTLSAQNKYVSVVSNGTKWLIVAQN